ncbi:MAG: SDR family oxidoreductase [Rhodothermia bacterium]
MNNKVIIVTGSANGIGKAIAKRLVQGGARVLIHDKDADGARSVSAKLGDRAAFHVDDLVDPKCPGRIVEAALDAFGQINGLVNNAAFVPRANVEATTVALFDQAVAVNVRAPFLLIQAALPHLVPSKGCILNIGSINANSGEPNLMAYSVAKGALQTLTRNLGDALNREYGIRVNQINPGWVLTENEHRTQLAQGMPDDWPARLSREMNPSGTLIAPETIAEAAVFWLSDSSRPVSGSVVDMEQFPLIGRSLTKHIEK